jgi:hypothetical protein
MKKIFISTVAIITLASCSKKNACDSANNIMLSNQSLYYQTLSDYQNGDAGLSEVNAKLSIYQQSTLNYNNCLKQNQ